MASHQYSLRSRLDTQSPALRTTPTCSPVVAKAPAAFSRKTRPSDITLQLHRVIGTTTNNPNGLTCCESTNSYAYCAGAVAVLAKLEPGNAPSHRYFKARPTAPSLHPPTSHYENSPVTTPSKRRTTTFTPRKGQDEQNGGYFGRDWLDESTGQTWTARERIKTVSCVALSQDGRWLAVGESGYGPRVLLFSTADEAPCDVPTSIVSDHTHGVQCVAFSSDMKYLATLGNLNDGFLFVWSLNSRTGQLALHSVNKCTTSVCDMAWCGNSLITVGTRHIKIWQTKDTTKKSPSKKPRFFRASEAYSPSPGPAPGPAPLQGRNCLLGTMVDSTFTCVAVVDDQLAVVGTETGHLCLVDTSQDVLELRILKKMDFSISSITYVAETKRVLIGTSHGLQSEDFNLLLGSQVESPKASKRKPPRHSIRRSLGLVHQTVQGLTAVGTLQSHVITLDNNGTLKVQTSENDDQSNCPLTSAAHNSTVLGVQVLPASAGMGAFFTWSRNGEVKFWSSDGELLKQEVVDLEESGLDDDGCENEMNQVHFLPALGCFVAGDRFGVIRLIRYCPWQILQTIRSHSAEVTSIASHEAQALVATCSRDRMIQVFRVGGENLDLLQTLDEHVGAVNQVLFVQNGEKLLSCSSDRSLVIRDRVLRNEGGVQTPAYLTTKVVTLKGAPLSMAISTENKVLVSTMDRRVTKVDISTGALTDSFKVGDSENDETVCLNRIASRSSRECTDASQRLVIGYCSMDKSIRVYNGKNMMLLGRESGHTEGVSDIALLEHSGDEDNGRHCTAVSTGLDGTIMIWRILSHTSVHSPHYSQERTQGLGISSGASEDEWVKPSPASLPPLRKVLTKLDIAELTKESGLALPSSPQTLSPMRLKRKTSRLALTSTLDDVEEAPSRALESSVARNDSPKKDPRRSPSPPPLRVTSRLTKQPSRTDLSRDLESAQKAGAMGRSVSPPPMPISMPTTPKTRNKSNNGRLRRAPSVPTDLRSHHVASSRRQSMSQASEFGSLGMATEQAARMLKTYRKKLASSRDIVSLDDLEDEVRSLLTIIQERKDRTLPAMPQIHREGVGSSGRRAAAKAATESDVDRLTVLLERANMADTHTMFMKAAKGQDAPAKEDMVVDVNVD
ncbi:WD40-repeat-containing domain protein [Exophiala viscosa]|uniref:WD40-repeat-containing domain protein n=1 Tax=Exophiala viscosa TaxID=2486360 RepID=A0AAN6IEV4_9EURO|nr:WD40-repeat-containing domain protein [Exophiala viscosa]KAI1624158.1 WD40-repeat-containing domain protein [Exophiala viscosa]